MKIFWGKAWSDLIQWNQAIAKLIQKLENYYTKVRIARFLQRRA